MFCCLHTPLGILFPYLPPTYVSPYLYIFIVSNFYIFWSICLSPPTCTCYLHLHSVFVVTCQPVHLPIYPPLSNCFMLMTSVLLTVCLLPRCLLSRCLLVTYHHRVSIMHLYLCTPICPPIRHLAWCLFTISYCHYHLPNTYVPSVVSQIAVYLWCWCSEEGR